MTPPAALISIDLAVGPWHSEEPNGAGRLREVLELVDNLTLALGALLENDDELQFIAPDGTPHTIRLAGIHAGLLDEVLQ